MQRYLIVGGGIAAMQAAETIRGLRRDDPITLIAEEDRPFYLRPLLADLVAGRIQDQDIWLEFEATAAAKNISLMLGRQAVGLNYRRERTVSLSSREEVPYDLLLIATGARPVLPEIPGADLEGVTTFSAYADAVKVKAWAEQAKRAVVVGQGLQALELVRALRLRGLEVTLVVPDDTPWFLPLFQTDEQTMERILAEHGVKVLVLDRAVELVGRAGRVRAVKTREGHELPAEIVGFAGGQRGETNLLSGSGIAVEAGVVTDEHLRTTDEMIWAAGDVAEIQASGTEQRAHGYGWIRASAHGQAAGHNMCGEHVAVEIGENLVAQSLYGLSLAARWR